MFGCDWFLFFIQIFLNTMCSKITHLSSKIFSTRVMIMSPWRDKKFWALAERHVCVRSRRRRMRTNQKKKSARKKTERGKERERRREKEAVRKGKQKRVESSWRGERWYCCNYMRCVCGVCDNEWKEGCSGGCSTGGSDAKSCRELTEKIDRSIESLLVVQFSSFFISGTSYLCWYTAYIYIYTRDTLES